MGNLKERDIEKYLKDKVENIGGLCMKWVSPGNSGVPDRIVIYCGSVYFIELKRPGERPRVLQAETIRRLQDQGQIAFVIDSRHKIDKFIELIKSVPFDIVVKSYTQYFDYDGLDDMHEMYRKMGYYA